MSTTQYNEGFQMNETTIAAPAPWLPGDEGCAKVYSLVLEGMPWAEACTRIGVTFHAAQSRYRARGLPSPRRSTPAPAGGWPAACQRVYDRVLLGETTRDACRAEGISLQSMRRFSLRSAIQTPARLMAETRQAIRSQHKKTRRTFANA